MVNALFITIFLSLLISRGGGTLGPFLIFELVIGCYIVILIGAFALRTAKIKDVKCQSLLFIPVGTLISGLFIFLLSICFGISAGSSFLCQSFFMISLILLLDPKSIFKNFIFSSNQIIDSLALLFFITFTLLWCWKISASFPILEKHGILSTWQDVYAHGSNIAQFNDPKAVGHGDIHLYGVKVFFYHYGIYMLPAVIAQVANLPGIAAATALLLPIGVLLLSIAIYTLGAQIANRSTGIIATIFILVLPDSSLYLLKNGFLGFHYILQVAPGTGYGLAGCLISLFFFIQWLRDKSISTLIFSLILACLVFVYRAHFFILYFPTLIASIFILYSKKKYQTYFLLGCLLISFFFLLVFFIKPIKLFWLTHSAILTFLNIVHLERGDNTYSGFYNFITHFHRPILTAMTGTALMLLAILNAWIIVYIYSLYAKIHRFGLEALDLFPCILFIAYIGVILFAPVTYNNCYDELQHRPFGLLYAIIIIFSLGYVFKIIDNQYQIASSYIKISFISFIFIGILWTITHHRNDLGRLMFRGASRYQDYHLSANREIVNVALFLRKKAMAKDTFLISKDDTINFIDSSVIISSISGMPSYLARPLLELNQVNPQRHAVVQYRDKIRNSINNASTFSDAISLMNSQNISWYITFAPPKWDTEIKRSKFKSGTITVYQAST